MLVIKAEIWPQGDHTSGVEIARIAVVNRGGDVRSLADYNVIGLLGRDQREQVAEGVVLAHFRHNGWRPLATNALRSVDDGPSLFHPEYTQAVVDLLRKG